MCIVGLLPMRAPIQMTHNRKWQRLTVLLCDIGLGSGEQNAPIRAFDAKLMHWYFFLLASRQTIPPQSVVLSSSSTVRTMPLLMGGVVVVCCAANQKNQCIILPPNEQIGVYFQCSTFQWAVTLKWFVQTVVCIGALVEGDLTISPVRPPETVSNPPPHALMTYSSWWALKHHPITWRLMLLVGYWVEWGMFSDVIILSGIPW